ncbi:MAG: hypothetical protein GY862_09400 [Gammaproteobacteria bacterium]|nr:hypothetical protein [Gammaproteobacteria bacterium]
MQLDPLPVYRQGRLHIPVVNVPGSGRYSLDLNLETANLKTAGNPDAAQKSMAGVRHHPQDAAYR